jgi:NADH-quinone oxidoreductase subunit C
VTASETRVVPVSDWRSELAGLREEGLVYLDLLAALDRGDEREVVVHLVDPASGRRVLATTRVPAAEPALASLAGVFPAAAWHEREAMELVGLVFDGHPDPRPLLLRERPERPPLLVSTPLVERLATTWPGAADSGDSARKRRPTRPPGVRGEWVTRDAS